MKKIIALWAAHEKACAIGFFAFLIVFPMIFKSYYIRNIAVLCLLYSLLSLSLNLIMGYTGIAVLGMAAFYGIGAYTFAILSTRLGFTFIPAAICAFLASRSSETTSRSLISFIPRTFSRCFWYRSSVSSRDSARRLSSGTYLLRFQQRT